jgi:putative tryptophan/tyrosine transport system substrate-binding protein
VRNRREFMTLLGGAAAAWPVAARAQQGERVRRIGALMNLAADDPEALGRITAFVQGLQQLGWTDGRNARIIARWAAGNADNFRKYAAELVALGPDTILASATPAVLALQQATNTVPIVFAQVTDPVGAGIVASLARPGGNTTGFSAFEYGVSGQMVGAAKRDCARRKAGGGAPGPYDRDRPVGRDPGRGTVIGCGGERDRRAGRR